MMKPLACLALVAAAASAAAAPPHEHGVAQLDVAVEAARVTLLLALPLDSLLGFEHAPRTDGEKSAADAALARLNAAATLFHIDPAAGCRPARAELRSGTLALGGAAPAKEGHDDLEASYEFACKDGFKAGFVETGLFEAFARLQRVEVQAVTRKGQMKATLRRPVGRLPLAR